MKPLQLHVSTIYTVACSFAHTAIPALNRTHMSKRNYEELFFHSFDPHYAQLSAFAEHVLMHLSMKDRGGNIRAPSTSRLLGTDFQNRPDRCTLIASERHRVWYVPCVEFYTLHYLRVSSRRLKLLSLHTGSIPVRIYGEVQQITDACAENPSMRDDLIMNAARSVLEAEGDPTLVDSLVNQTQRSM